MNLKLTSQKPINRSRTRPIVKFGADRKIIATYPERKEMFRVEGIEETRSLVSSISKALRSGYVRKDYTYQYEDVFKFESGFH